MIINIGHGHRGGDRQRLDIVVRARIRAAVYQLSQGHHTAVGINVGGTIPITQPINQSLIVARGVGLGEGYRSGSSGEGDTVTKTVGRCGAGITTAQVDLLTIQGDQITAATA